MHPLQANASSRPKIHKLPAIVAPAPKKQYKNIMFVGGALASLVLAVVLFNEFASLAAKHIHQVSSDKSMQISQLAPISNAQAESTSISDKQHGIAGQLTPIPEYQGVIANIETMSEVDRREGQELLSIVSKY